MPTKMEMKDRLDKFIQAVPFSGCWIWMGHVDKDGYGKIDNTTAHKAAYRQLIGEVPDGMELDHRCEVRCCVNPSHLNIVTPKKNKELTLERGRHFQRNMTHCEKGHPFSGENLYINPNNNKRICRACSAVSQKKYKDKVRNLRGA
jgi:hypothetical protein